MRDRWRSFRPWWVWGAVGAVVALVGLRGAGAEESRYTKDIYHLDLRWEKPVRLLVGEEPEAEPYWFVRFSITNRDMRDHRFFVSVSARSDKGVSYRCNEEPAVLERVRRQLGLHEGDRLASCSALTIEHDPARVPPSFPTRVPLPLIRAGETIEAVAIFRGPDPEANHLTVTWEGLTNDVQIVPTGQPHERKLIERVFHVEFYRGGDEFYARDEWYEEVGHRWEQRETVIKTDLE